MSSGDSPMPDKTADEPSGARQEWTWLARIRRPQGRKGEVFADVLTDFPEKFAERRELWLVKEPEPAKTHGSTVAPRAVTLTNHWMHKGGIVLHFAGVDSISAAEELAGLTVAIPRSERVPLAEDEAYIGDLIGCVLVDVAESRQAVVGTIEDVDRTAGPVALLIVRAAGGKHNGDEILIPFAKSYLRKVDPEQRRVEMALPKGLVDLDEAEEA